MGGAEGGDHGLGWHEGEKVHEAELGHEGIGIDAEEADAVVALESQALDGEAVAELDGALAVGSFDGGLEACTRGAAEEEYCGGEEE